MAQRVNSEEFDSLLDSPVILADFYGDGCVPCKRISPLIAELEEEYGNVKFVKINVGYDEELAAKYEVKATPTLILFKNGKESGRLQGAVKKEEIESLING